MKKRFALVLAVVFVSMLAAPAIFAGGPDIPPHPTGAEGVGDFVAALMAAIAAFLAGGGGGEP